MHTKKARSQCVGVLPEGSFEAGSLSKSGVCQGNMSRGREPSVHWGTGPARFHHAELHWEMHADLCPAATQPSLHKAQEHALRETHIITKQV